MTLPETSHPRWPRAALSALVERHPALSLFLLASVLGVFPLALTATGLVPSGFFQLGALSASTAGIILAAVEGGARGVGELLRRGLIWRVGARWWGVALLYIAPIALVALLAAQSVGLATIDWTALGPVWRVAPMMLALIILAGLGEEFGWRTERIALPTRDRRAQLGHGTGSGPSETGCER